MQQGKDETPHVNNSGNVLKRDIETLSRNLCLQWNSITYPECVFIWLVI